MKQFDGWSQTFVTGTVKNDGESRSNTVNVKAVFKDESGSVLSTRNWGALYLDGGQAWNVAIPSRTEQTPASGALEVSEGAKPDLDSSDLKVVDSSAHTGENPRVTGTVKNSGSSDLEQVATHVRFLDSEKNIIGQNVRYLTAKGGATTAFEVPLSSPYGNEFESYHIVLDRNASY
ncbi:FxLYD domain-containing protein (plasmid) [Haladaptatus sp. SPP-AMP-3]|uniref:FxLYD domain-containing protein n=1 Tax=Haladaptatus sp. SPP-AMP-3 TaxID=3121295 RepID=UPI003C2DFE65